MVPVCDPYSKIAIDTLLPGFFKTNIFFIGYDKIINRNQDFAMDFMSIQIIYIYYLVWTINITPSNAAVLRSYVAHCKNWKNLGYCLSL